MSRPTPRAGSDHRSGRVALDDAFKALDLIRPSPPRLAQDFTATKPDGGTFRLSEHRGRVVFINFAIGLDPKMELANAYGVRALPATFIVDPAGYLAALALGPRQWDSDASHLIVKELSRRAASLSPSAPPASC